MQGLKKVHPASPGNAAEPATKVRRGASSWSWHDRLEAEAAGRTRKAAALRRKPWHQLPDDLPEDRLALECVRLGLGRRRALGVGHACQDRGVPPKLGVGIVRALRQGFNYVCIDEVIREFPGSPEELYERCRGGRYRGSSRPSCPRGLRRMVIKAFDRTCEHCGRRGTATKGPDGEPWHVDQIEPLAGYRPHNVTLACARCNLKRNAKPAPEETRSLADVCEGSRTRTIRNRLLSSRDQAFPALPAHVF